MDKEHAAPLKIQVLGLSGDFLDEVRHALKNEPDMQVSFLQGGVEALHNLEQATPPDVLIVRKTKRSEDFYQFLGHFIQRFPATGIILSAPFKDPDMMVKALHAGVKEFLFEPFQPGEISAIVKRLGKPQHWQEQDAHKARVLAFIPCKGGSGATFLAANLAHILADKFNKEVLLVDLNLQFGDAYLYLMDHTPQNTLGEVCGSFVRFDYQFLESAVVRLASGVRLLAAPENPADAELVKPEHIESIVAAARKHFDFVILDVGRFFDAVTLKALDLADEVYPVLQLILPSIRDAQRMNVIFKSLNYSENKVRWVINRYGGQGDLGAGDASRVIGEPFWKMPNDHKHVAESVNQGISIDELYPHSPAGKSLKGLAEALLSADAPSKPKKHWSLFR